MTCMECLGWNRNATPGDWDAEDIDAIKEPCSTTGRLHCKPCLQRGGDGGGQACQIWEKRYIKGGQIAGESPPP